MKRLILQRPERLFRLQLAAAVCGGRTFWLRIRWTRPTSMPYTLIEEKNTNCFTPSRFAFLPVSTARRKLTCSNSARFSAVSRTWAIPATSTTES